MVLEVIVVVKAQLVPSMFIFAENLGFTSYPQAYLSKKAKGRNLLIGANFASAASAYYDGTAKLYSAISLPQQLEHYKDYINRIQEIATSNNANATSIISDGIYVVSAGSSDFIQNYYINPLLYKNLYSLGARRIGVTTLPPLGCLPAAITVAGPHEGGCSESLNNDAISFNSKLNATSQDLKRNLVGLNLVVFDIYQPLYDLATRPSEFGFAEARRACCGTGLLETSILCNPKSVGTCTNATEYVFWDGFHPTEAANKILSDNLLLSGISLIS
ncbi:hypothetical protein IGI04_005214 [Brassica rapa subsp. trilocularis]|uniref:GDSL esterase/lipase n=1 Tax=Brassica rapa subsp. trilocularis TaxID=1813537 RepID=A0ABQ7NFR4_BRACM|nr:hypothetical protein IGI04_005214 [Brassica rapa subsp. trilocularis]